jgi:hypothetical protein
MNKQGHWYLALAAVAFSLMAFVLFGIVGVGRGGSVHFSDVRYFHLAGAMVVDGASPYDLAAFRAAAVKLGSGPDIWVFPYPPHSLSLWVPLSWLTLEQARWTWTALNALVLLVIAWGAARTYQERVSSADGGPVSTAALWVAAIVIGSPFAAHLVWTGQTGLFVMGCLLLAWRAQQAGSWVAAGIALGVATIKPQLAILVFAWFVLMGSFRVVGVALATAGLLLAYAVIQLGPDVVTQWAGAAMTYQREVATGLPYNTNLKSLLIGLGVPLSPIAAALMPVAALGYTAWLAMLQRRSPRAPADVLAALLITSLFLVQGRDYDIAVLAPVVAMLFWWTRGDRATQLLAVVMLLLLFLPLRLITLSGWPPLSFLRILVLGCLWAWVTWILWRAPQLATTSAKGALGSSAS